MDELYATNILNLDENFLLTGTSRPRPFKKGDVRLNCCGIAKHHVVVGGKRPNKSTSAIDSYSICVEDALMVAAVDDRVARLVVEREME